MGKKGTRGESLSRFEAADYVTSVDEVVAYLEAVAEEADDDPVLIAQALGVVARSRMSATWPSGLA